MATVDEWRRASRLGAQSRHALMRKATGQAVDTIKGYSVVALVGLEYGLVIVEDRNIFLAKETYETICSDAGALGQFYRSFCRDGVSPGTKYLAGIDWWDDARRAHAEKARTNLIQAKDKITLLTEQAASLFHEAVDMKTATHSQRSAAYGRLADLRSQMSGIENDFDRLRAVLELTELAVGDV